MQIAKSSNRQWSKLGPTAKASVIAGGLIQLILLVAALVDIRRRSVADIRGSKAVWYGLSFVNFIGPISYFAFGRRR